ncbi:MAG: DUF4340 domain-containing protein [Saprospiraceae bacterium]|nr:DUF4340 domain-containing protein [Saprospiraceae bacterium]
MKRLIILFVLVLLLGGIAFILKKDHDLNEKGIVMPDRQFTVESVNDVYKIFVAQKNEEPLTFIRKDQKWWINDRYPADDAVMIPMLVVLEKMKMLYIPPKASNKTIAESIGKNGIKVELYDKSDKVLKVFYIGTDTQNGDGTHMILDGFAQPYAMHLPGMMGGLRSRFEQPLRNYRDKAVFEVKGDDIEAYSIFFHKDINASFKIKKEAGTYTVKPYDPLTPEIKDPLNVTRVSAYLGGFERLAAEAIVNENKARDSILRLVPFCTIELAKSDGTSQKADFFSYDEIVIKEKKTRKVEDAHQIDRFFVQVENGDFYIVQRRVFSRLFTSYQNFFSKNE